VVTATSNALSLVLSYLWSLSWTANQDMIERLRSITEARGYYYSLFIRFVFPIVLLACATMSLILTVGLFYTLKLGWHGLGMANLIASIAANIILLQAVFVRRSVRKVIG
jgi:hypothetical protein